MDVLNFVIVGHVDHGKSTLIGRLLYDTESLPPDKIEEISKASDGLGRDTEFAYLLDHLEEERKQGITIDTTQVFFKTDKRRYVIIDAPGHVEFVKNMITGASQAEAAVLIVDVEEGAREQTRRHSYMLALLGLHQVIVVLNKMDLVGFSEDRFNVVKKEVSDWLASINVAVDVYIPISAIKGENITKKSDKMPWYSGTTFLDSLDTLKNKIPPENKSLLFPIQDVYKVGDKRINVGRVEAGAITTGAQVKILPTGQTTKVKSIEKFLEDTQEAIASECIGITTEDSVFLDRGNIICVPGSEPHLTDRVKANIFWMSKRPFTKDQKLTLRCATQETTCKIDKIARKINSSTLELIGEDADDICNLEVAEVIIKTKKPVAIKDFNDVQEMGRFVLVRDENTCAGGIITTEN
ncbi:MAG: adenylyl-sulfate kinase [Planctomycetota bacterium]|mgnify:CR=1 FL=1|nr:MAG: adenylyl-sulfate kinase [Planctomycetota bacterium]